MQLPPVLVLAAAAAAVAAAAAAKNRQRPSLSLAPQALPRRPLQKPPLVREALAWGPAVMPGWAAPLSCPAHRLLQKAALQQVLGQAPHLHTAAMLPPHALQPCWLFLLMTMPL